MQRRHQRGWQRFEEEIAADAPAKWAEDEVGPLWASGGSSEEQWPGPGASGQWPVRAQQWSGQKAFTGLLGMSVTRREFSYFRSFTSEYRIVAG